MQRLHDSAKIYRMPVEYSVDELMEACRATLRKNNLSSGYIRPLVFIGDVGMGVNPPQGYKTDVIIAAFPWGAYLGEEALDAGIDAMVSSGTAQPLTPFRQRPKQAVTTCPRYWSAVKPAVTVIRKGLRWM